jgi:hypothetical protein
MVAIDEQRYTGTVAALGTCFSSAAAIDRWAVAMALVRARGEIA